MMTRLNTVAICLPLFIALLGLPAVQSKAAVVIDMTTSGVTGSALDVGTALADLPITVPVAEAPGLNLIIQSGNSSAGNLGSILNGTASSFGINSAGSDETAMFDVDLSETLTIAFSQGVTILGVKFNSFTGSETFSFGGISIADGDADGSNNYVFTGGGLTVGANVGVVLEAGGPTGSSVGIESITIDDVTAIPEPSSVAMLGVGGVLMWIRRRRA